MNKLYYFHGADDESGVFIGAESWKEARKYAIGHECMDGSEFIDIRGSLCKENGKTVYTEKSGEHEAHEILATGYTVFWWSGDCNKCGKWHERLSPVNGELICSDCEESPNDEDYGD